MKILILTHSYPDSNHKWRGVFVREQARVLAKNHEIYVVYFKADYTHLAPFSKYTYIKESDGQLTTYEVTITKSFPVITQLKYLSNTFAFIKNEILNNVKVDIIHSHLSYPAGFLGTIIQNTKQIPNILTEHSTLRLYYRSFIHRLCVRYALRNASGVISVSSALKNDIISIRNKEVHVIPNIVDTALFKLAKPGDEQILNIGFLGGLNNNNKGLDLLIKSASLIKNRKYILHIGGDGKLLDSYKLQAKESGIEDNCRFYGEIARNEISDFYSRLDIFILPSRYETFGIVLIEAMACGIPVIATKSGGPRDIVTENTGLLIEKDDPEALAKAILKLTDNLKSYNREDIRNYAKDKFGEEAFTHRIIKLYEEILMKNG